VRKAVCLALASLLLCPVAAWAGSSIPAGAPHLTAPQAQSIKSVALRNRFVRELSAGSRVHASAAIPWIAEGGGRLLGGVTHLYLSPAVDLEDQKLPATISPNEHAPPGTPTLYRYVRMSATGVEELEVQVKFRNREAVRIEPSGTGYSITKAELIGPPPRPARFYAPEPGR
jgi:hypothetical protein